MASKMLNAKLITKQTGAAGRICNTVAVVETVHSKEEKYFAILMDRAFGGPVVVASAQVQFSSLFQSSLSPFSLLISLLLARMLCHSHMSMCTLVKVGKCENGQTQKRQHDIRHKTRSICAQQKIYEKTLHIGSIAG